MKGEDTMGTFIKWYVILFCLGLLGFVFKSFSGSGATNRGPEFHYEEEPRVDPIYANLQPSVPAQYDYSLLCTLNSPGGCTSSIKVFYVDGENLVATVNTSHTTSGTARIPLANVLFREVMDTYNGYYINVSDRDKSRVIIRNTPYKLYQMREKIRKSGYTKPILFDPAFSHSDPIPSGSNYDFLEKSMSHVHHTYLKGGFLHLLFEENNGEVIVHPDFVRLISENGNLNQWSVPNDFSTDAEILPDYPSYITLKAPDGQRVFERVKMLVRFFKSGVNDWCPPMARILFEGERNGYLKYSKFLEGGNSIRIFYKPGRLYVEAFIDVTPDGLLLRLSDSRDTFSPVIMYYDADFPDKLVVEGSALDPKIVTLKEQIRSLR